MIIEGHPFGTLGFWLALSDVLEAKDMDLDADGIRNACLIT